MSKKTDKLKLLPLQTKMLSCQLTDDEIRACGQKLAKVLEDIGTENARQLSFRQQMKATLTELEAQAMGLGSKIRRGEELRDVDIQPEIDFVKDVYREHRTDTGEVILERPIEDDERQENFGFDEKTGSRKQPAGVN